MQHISINDLTTGCQASIISIQESYLDSQRLAEIGFLPGTPLKILGHSPFGDAVILSLRGSRLALRKSDACQILVQLITPEHESKADPCQPQTSVPAS